MNDRDEELVKFLKELVVKQIESGGDYLFFGLFVKGKFNESVTENGGQATVCFSNAIESKGYSDDERNFILNTIFSNSRKLNSKEIYLASDSKH